MNTNMVRFNQKVRRGNSKVNKRKRSKGRRQNKSKGKKVGSRSSSLAKLKLRVPKIAGKSQFKDENSCEEKEENYDPKKRGIGMEFLEYLKKKPGHKGTKILFSAQKTTSDWGLSIKNERASEMKNYIDWDDLSNVLYDINNKEERKSTSSIESVKEEDSNRENEVLEPVYDTREFKNSRQKLSMKVWEKSKMKGKRKSRSKNRRNSSGERKETKNSSTESGRKFKPINNFKNKKGSITRPFSGGYQKPIHPIKPNLKVNKTRQRPKTAKQMQKKLESEYKSPKNKKSCLQNSHRKKQRN